MNGNGKGNGKDKIDESSKSPKNGGAVKNKKKVKSLKAKAKKSNIEKNGAIEGNGELLHDDLKEVNGIGPKLEKVLNKKGITTFSQLSELDIGLVAGAEGEPIDLAGRIEREDWIGQARKLMKKGEGKSK